MKELSIEQKAKAYDKAVINGSRLWECGEITRENYEYIFPELKESEDERIRKWCISHFKECISVTKDNDEYKKYLSNEVIAWLEKQGEPTEINPSEFNSQLNRLLKQFESLPKEELASSLSFYLNVVQNDRLIKKRNVIL